MTSVLILDSHVDWFEEKDFNRIWLSSKCPQERGAVQDPALGRLTEEATGAASNQGHQGERISAREEEEEIEREKGEREASVRKKDRRRGMAAT